MRTITLTAASNIQRSADVYTSKEGLDVGSTYFRFTCAMCQNPLGLYYLTTSKDLDELREKFSFSYESVTLYEIGKAQHGVDNPVPFNASDPLGTAEDGDESSSSHSNGLNLKEPTNKEEIGRVSKYGHGMLIS
jgi:Yippee zinc-binding/DNA-binding /Mis18, centromere assembly